MLLRSDPVSKTIAMLSFPRDLGVEIHCPGITPYTDKINAAYSQLRRAREPGDGRGAHRTCRSTT